MRSSLMSNDFVATVGNGMATSCFFCGRV